MIPRKGDQVFCKKDWISEDNTIRFKKSYIYVVNSTDSIGVNIYSSADVGMIHWDMSFKIWYINFDEYFCSIQEARKLKLKQLDEKR